MTKKGLEKSVVTLASMTAGAMVSRIVAEKLPIKKTKLKRGVLIVAGIVGASALDQKTTGRKIGQDMAISVAVTQTGYLLKELLDDKLKDNKLLHPALGNPMYDGTSFLSSYTGDYGYDYQEEPFGEINEFQN